MTHTRFRGGMHTRARCCRLLLVLFLALACWPAAGWSQYYPIGRRPFGDSFAKEHAERARSYDLEHVLLRVTLDERNKSVAGTATLTLRPLRPGLETIEVDSAELRIHSVTLADSGTLSFDQEGETLRIRLPRPASPTDVLTLAIAYDGNPRKGLYFFAPDRSYPRRHPQIWSQGEMEDSHFWFPVYDYPNDRTSSEGYYTVRSDFTVISNGQLLGVTEHPASRSKTFHWKQEVPHSTYLISVVAGMFEKYGERAGSVPLDYYVPSGTGRDKAMLTFRETPAAMRFFEDRMGFPYPYPKYSQATVQEFTFGGMENISATTLSDRTLHEAAAEPQSSSVDLVTHELAHQWFGDLVTCANWSHLWLNEGFATFWAAAYREHRDGWDQYLYEVFEDRNRYLDEDRQRYRRPLVTSYYSDPIDLFDRTTYQKGFMVLDMLRFVLGDERFFRALSHYLKTYQRQTVVTDDFRKAVEEASGENLGWFFDQWVYKAGYPELAVSQEWDAERREVRLIVEQTQALDQMTPLFRMPVDVEFTTAAGAKKVRIEFSQAREEFPFPLDSQPVMTRFDPEGRVLMTVQFSKPAAELLHQLQHDPSAIGRIWAGEQLTAAAGDRAEIARALRERLLRDSFWGVRRAAAAALGQLKTDEARAALSQGLQDRDPRVRQASVRALAQFFKDQQADRLVRRLYDSERNPVTAAEAVFAVGRIQANGARGFLEKALRRDSDQDVIRRYALSGLRDLGDRGAWDIAVRWSRYGNPTQTRIVAVEAFSRLGGRDEKTADLLIALLEDPNLFVRERAIRELGEGGYQKARAALLRIADTEAQSSTRRAAQAALARLGGATQASFSAPPGAPRAASSAARLLVP